MEIVNSSSFLSKGERGGGKFSTKSLLFYVLKYAYSVYISFIKIELETISSPTCRLSSKPLQPLQPLKYSDDEDTE